MPAADGADIVRDMAVKVSSKFDAGNVEVRSGDRCSVAAYGTASSNPCIQVVDATDPQNVQLKIRPDPYCKGDDITHFQ